VRTRNLIFVNIESIEVFGFPKDYGFGFFGRQRKRVGDDHRSFFELERKFVFQAGHNAGEEVSVDYISLTEINFIKIFSLVADSLSENQVSDPGAAVGTDIIFDPRASKFRIPVGYARDQFAATGPQIIKFLFPAEIKIIQNFLSGFAARGKHGHFEIERIKKVEIQKKYITGNQQIEENKYQIENDEFDRQSFGGYCFALGK